MEAVGHRRALFAAAGKKMWIAAGAIVVVLAVVLLRESQSPRSPQTAPTVAGAVAHWPALAIPLGDGGVRLQLGASGGTLVMHARSAFPARRFFPFRVISFTTGRVWRLRTDDSGRAQIALPPGRYGLRQGATNIPGAAVWKFDVRGGLTVTHRYVQALP